MTLLGLIPLVCFVSTVFVCEMWGKNARKCLQTTTFHVQAHALLVCSPLQFDNVSTFVDLEGMLGKFTSDNIFKPSDEDLIYTLKKT